MGFHELSRTSRTYDHVTGRLSDGSDRVVTPVTEWLLSVQDDDGREYGLKFGHNPTDAEIVTALPTRAREIIPEEKADLEVYVKGLWSTWWMWHTAHTEAVARTETAALVTALLNRRNTAWTAYKVGLNTWRQAS